MATLVFFSSIVWVSELVVFAYMGSSDLSLSYGSHATSSTVAQWLSVPMMGKQQRNQQKIDFLRPYLCWESHGFNLHGTGLLVLIPCSYCCVAKGVAGQDASILAPMVPMEPLGGDAAKTANAI